MPRLHGIESLCFSTADAALALQHGWRAEGLGCIGKLAHGAVKMVIPYQIISTAKTRVTSARSLALLLLLFFAGYAALSNGESVPVREPRQPVDDAYTARIHQHSPQPFSTLTLPPADYLLASKNLPAPEAVPGDVAGQQPVGAAQ